MGKLRWFLTGVVTGLSAAAIGQELQKDPEQRTWKGKVAGVPYNFRLNEWPDIATEYWNPKNEEILVPHTLGLGWGVNFAAVAQRARHMAEARQSNQIPEPVER